MPDSILSVTVHELEFNCLIALFVPITKDFITIDIIAFEVQIGRHQPVV